MSNQEMQFADPDWKPSQQLGSNSNQQEQEVYTPQPINNESLEQNKWGSAPYALPPQEGYTGLPPYTRPIAGQMQGGNFRQRPYSRRGRGPLFWIILALIIFSLIGGGSRFNGAFGPGNGPNFDHNPFEQGQVMKPFTATVNGQANIVINDQNADVTVTESQSNTVMIQPVNGSSFPGNPTSIQQNISQIGNNITANVPNSQDLQVSVPLGTNVSLNTGSGNINFDGTLPSTGTNQFQTTDGDITITVPSDSAFHLDASTGTGAISSDFSSVIPHDSTSGSGQSVIAVVGGSSQSQGPNVVIRSDNGNIHLNHT